MSALLSQLEGRERRAECERHERRCYVCNAEPQDGCQAVDGQMAECPRPSTAPRTILRARNLNQTEQGE